MADSSSRQRHKQSEKGESVYDLERRRLEGGKVSGVRTAFVSCEDEDDDTQSDDMMMTIIMIFMRLNIMLLNLMVEKVILKIPMTIKMFKTLKKQIYNVSYSVMVFNILENLKNIMPSNPVKRL